jgi:uncharacterized membrane protein
MTKILVCYTATLIAFIAIDMVWLVWLARSLYVQEMGSLLRAQPNLTAAIAFYLIYAAGLVFFAVWPGVTAGSIMTAALYGAIFGFVAYATYDMTGLAVIEGFGLRIAIIDMVWGAVLSGTVAAIGAAATRIIMGAGPA